MLGANKWYVGKQQQDYAVSHPWFRSIPHGCWSKKPFPIQMHLEMSQDIGESLQLVAAS